jgi:uncharacterized protein (TIGR02231 family)
VRSFSHNHHEYVLMKIILLIIVMESVTFTPHYTLRAVSSGTDSSLKIRYHARISNTSGEDWNDVSLAISTAQASETTVIPRLMRWTVDFQSPAPQNYLKQSRPRGANFVNVIQQADSVQRWQRKEVPEGLFGGGFEPESGVLNVDMATSAAEVSEGITSTFIIPGRQTIKDGEKSHTVVIRDLVLEGKFANICVPKIKEVAYLQVDLSTSRLINTGTRQE